ncbi:hypothetical protein M5689_012541 [Euphorbia peplus]|nr:hypothetical protein M5689_012541 [Euphorbia peplus]
MFFHALLRRRLESLLQPWLREQPDIEIELGFINSRVTAKSLRFDCSALNKLVEEPAGFSCKEVFVQEFSVRFSNWSFPALKIEVRGVNVTVLAGEEKDEGSSAWARKSIEKVNSDKKKAVAEIDPEGSALHDVLERILHSAPSKSWFTLSLLDLVLKHCHLQIFNTNFQVKVPILNETLLYLFELKEFGGGSQDFEYRCLLRGFFSEVFSPVKETSIGMDFRGFSLRYEMEDANTTVFSTDLFSCIKLNDLQLSDLSIRVPELNVLLSPLDLLVLSVANLPSKESKCIRNGRQLWKLAASRLGYGISSSRSSLHNLVGFVCLWLRYLNAYESFLSLLGYSADNKLKKLGIEKFHDKMFLSSVNQSWEVISHIEKELPAESIAQARRIARHRALFDSPRREKSHKRTSEYSHFNFFSQILTLLLVAWSFIYRVFCAIVHGCVSIKCFVREPKSDRKLDNISQDSPKCCFLLNFGKILMTFSPNSIVQNVNEKVESHIGISHADMQSFCLSMDALLFVYVDAIFEKSYSVSCGLLNFKSSTVIREKITESSLNHLVSSVQGDRKRITDNSKTVLWSEPAEMIIPLQRSETNAATDSTYSAPLKSCLEEMWLTWNQACTNYDDNDIEYSEKPWLLCEIRNCLMYPGVNGLDYGIWKCSLMVGKLNVSLGYLSIVSMAILLGQIWYALNLTEDKRRRSALSQPVQATENQQEIFWEGKYEYLISKMKKILLKLFPEKRFQLGIFITGPNIQLSMRNTGSDSGNKGRNFRVREDDFHLGFDIHDIEMVVWPTSKSDLALNQLPGDDDAVAECHRLQELHIIEIPKPDVEKYASHVCVSLRLYLRVNGLNVYMGDSKELQESQIVVSKPIAVELSFCREAVHTFSSTDIALSSAMCGRATGLTVILYMDEWHTFFQVVADLSSAVTYAFSGFPKAGYVPLQDFIMQRKVSPDPVNDEINVESDALICDSTLFSINGSFDLKSVDVILQNARRSNKRESAKKTYIASRLQNLSGHDLDDYGVWVSVRHYCIGMIYEEDKVEVRCDILGVQSIIFGYPYQMGKSSDHLIVKHLQRQTENWLYEFSLPSFSFTLCLDYPHDGLSNLPGNSSLHSNVSNKVEISQLVVDSETSRAQSPRTESSDFASDISGRNSNHWILLNAILSGMFIARHSTKNIVVGSHQFNRFTSLLSVGRNFQTVSWRIQGGNLFLEPAAVVAFSQCIASYRDCIVNHLSIINSSTKLVENAEYEAQEILHATQQPDWKLPESFTTDVSQFSLILIMEDDSGCYRELVSELDARLKLELENTHKKFMFELSRMSICSKVLQERAHDEIQIPHFSSTISNGLTSPSSARDPTASFDVIDGSHLHHRNYILSHLAASVSAEKQMNDLSSSQLWIGDGSISGFHVTVSVSEIQMLLSMVSSSSSTYNEDPSDDLKQRSWSFDQEDHNSLEDMIPDGAIVAIQDLHQHMYFTVEATEDKYSLVGAIHYSLVGDKALFRVKHHKQKKWNSSVLLLSLISLHARNGSGEPLRLNYRPGSAFVDVSSINENGCSLWRTLCCDSESYKADTDWEPYNSVVKNQFYLVNQKNDCAVAFVDGIPQFVRKPGNPFKFKLFSNHTLARNVATSDGQSLEASASNLHSSAHNEEQTPHLSGKLPCIQITIEDADLTIVHELPDTKDRLPLVRGCINENHINLQILSYKARVMSTSCASIYYFDAHRNSWKELLHPVEICIFHRSSLQYQVSDIIQHGVPVHVYCRIDKLDISLTELSLDVLLFVIGEVKLSGPYSIRNSMILANCCKVENLLGLNLLCQFYDKKSVTVARYQSASVVLRQPIFASEPPKAESSITIQLSNSGSFATSSLNLSLSKTQTLAWRTRITSSSDSRSYPGPFVVVDISRRPKDGLSVVVSPLIKIHNETEFSMELRFRRLQQNEDVFASVFLPKGDSIDDSMATFDAISVSGELKKALMSLSLGNFLFSFRPEVTKGLINYNSSLSVDWSDELKGGKAVHLSGIFDRMSYKVRKALSVGSSKCSFSTAHCTLKSENAHVNSLHFLIQSIGRDVPIIHPDKSDNSDGRKSPVALQEQKEIFLLPTVRVSNLLHSEIHVLLTESDRNSTDASDNIGKQATIACGSTVDFYANPAIMYFTVSLTAFSSSCKPVNSGDWIKKLLKNKNDVECLDIDLDFGGGKYFALLRLTRGFRGTLEAAIFTPYSLRNNTDVPLFFFASNKKHPSRDEIRKYGSVVPPELGLFCLPNSTNSWFLKSHKMHLTMLENCASEVELDLDALSGHTEISLEIEGESGTNFFTKFGVGMGPSSSLSLVPSRTVTLTPRHVVFNESEESINIRQCYLEDGLADMVHIKGKQKSILQPRKGINSSKNFSFFENAIRKHKNEVDTSLVYIQFRLNEPESSWSGPVCIASLGCFFLKFRKQSNQIQALDHKAVEFAAVHVIEEGSTLGMHFYKPPKVNLPYRIENLLPDHSLTYYQKDSSEQEVLGPDSNVNYVWDDLILPHKLVVIISDMQLLREINLDKVRSWKPFRRLKQHRGLASHSSFNKKSSDEKTHLGRLNSMEIVKVGYEVYAEGPTRVLRICEFSSSKKGDGLFHSCAKIQLRVLHFAIHLLEDGKQDLDKNEEPCYLPLIVTRLGNINLDSLFTDQKKYNQISVQSLNVDEKWNGAPFGAMLRRHQSDTNDSNVSVLKVVLILLSTSSDVTQVEHSSIILQPLDLNLDEETLIRVASFYRTSLSNSPSQQYYFDHFEVHPIKIITNFIPEDSYSSYDSAQETLRSLLHSVVKVPPIKNMVVELNGVLVTHALITFRELFIRCARHYSWYAMRAIYIAKGSHLLPPDFVSMFDDLASSSLDAFFDPSRALVNLPGFTVGTFKFLSKCIEKKGFSGTKRYFGDLERTLKTVGSNVLFAAVTEISDSVLSGAERNGFDGMMRGIRQGILKLAMEPSLLGTALMEGGPDRKIKLDRNPGVDELYIEGYLQAMLDTMYRQEYLRVRVINDLVVLKNLPPSSTLIEEIMDHVKGFLVSVALLKGDPSSSSRSLRHLRGDNEWKILPTVITLCEHLFVSFAIRMLRKQTGKLTANIKWEKQSEGGAEEKAIVIAGDKKVKFMWKWGIGKFIFSGILAYIDGRLCRGIPNPVARRIVSGYLLSFLDKSESEQ